MSANDFNNPKGNSDTASILAELRRHYLSDDLPQTQKQEVKKAIDFYEKKFAAENGASASSAPVFYTADGRPVIPVYFPVDANGNPIAGFPGFNGASAEPEEEFEELPDGTKMKIIYQDAAFKKEEQENKEKKKQQKKPDADYFSSMKVVYESSEAFEEPEETEEKKEPEEPPKAEEVKAAEEPKAEETQSSLFEEKSSSLADLFSETNEESKEKAKKKKRADGESGFHRFLRNNLPWKGDPVSEIIRKIIMIIAVITLLCCCGYFVNLGVQEIRNTGNNNSLSSQLTPVSDDMNQTWNQLKAKYPGVKFPEGMNPRFADLYARNQDLVGWLSINNTKINFPIVQTKDNDYYLHRSYDKQETKYGNPFMDYSNTILPLNRNTVLYGHHMRTGSQVFTDLTKYRDIEGFKKSPTIKFSTLYADYTWKIYGVFLTNSRPSDDNGYVFNYIFKDLNSDEAFMNYMKAVDERKLYDTGVDVLPTDKILTLSTCEYDWDEARLVVVARLVRDGEDKGVDVSKAKVNANPRYPQAYYTKKGIDNPFKDAPKWTPNG